MIDPEQPPDDSVPSSSSVDGDDKSVAMAKPIMISDVDENTKSEQAPDDNPVKKNAVSLSSENTKSEQAPDDNPVKKNAVSLSSSPTEEQSSWFTKHKTFLIWSTIGIVIIAIVLAVVLPLITQVPPTTVEDPPTTVDFSTGVSLVTSYHVETRVRSRLSRTTITLTVSNALDCSSIHAISFQLPMNTRIASLKTFASDGCETNGVVQEIAEARETFLETAAKGVPGAYVEEAQGSTHSLQVAIPSLGETKVELVLEQLLLQRLGAIKFAIPFYPNENVDSIMLDLMVVDTTGEAADFEIDLNVAGVYEKLLEESSSTNVTLPPGPLHLDVPDAMQYELPQIISGTYNPGTLPESGVLYTDGKCFEHLFSPASLKEMPRNFHFILDTSESMNDGGWYNDYKSSKLDDAKRSLSTFIDTLKPEDTYTIQTFGNSGTEELWGSGPGTDEEKESAKEFISSLKASSWSTDLHEALLLGLLRARAEAEKSSDNVANILVLISDGYANRGETDRATIAEHVWERNQDGIVKIYSLGFEGSADMQLLDAIALLNGGVSSTIKQGVDHNAQITDFLDSEVGHVLMSDVNIEYIGSSPTTPTRGETLTKFPLLSEGYEVVVRGQFDGNVLNAVTTARTLLGINNWTLQAVATDDDTKASLCFQSYAHDRVTQLLRFYDASDFLGDDLIKRIVKLSSNKCEEKSFAKCVRGEALKLATEANIVAKGLTAMVTIDDDQCTKLDDEAEICLDGTTPEGRAPWDHDEGDHHYDHDEESAPEIAAMAEDSYGYSWSERNGASVGANICLVSALAILVAWCVMW